MTKRRCLLSLLAALIAPSVALPAVVPAGTGDETKTAPSPTRQFTLDLSLQDGTPVAMMVVASPSEEAGARAAMAEAGSLVASLDRDISSPGGLEERLGTLGKRERVELTEQSFALISRAVELSAFTGGWYDVAAPSPRGLIIQRDWRRISLHPAEAAVSFRSDGMRLDLKRIAPGFMADMAIGEIARRGFANARVAVGPAERNIGSDIFTPWTLQVSFGGKGAGFARRTLSLSIANAAMATVTPDGLGRNLTDPKGKRPANVAAAESVTVIAQDAAAATAYALAAYALGPKNGLKFLHAHPEAKGLFVDTAGNLTASEGLLAKWASPDASAPATPPDGGPNDLRQKEMEEGRD